jgi:hypothetical protein
MDRLHRLADGTWIGLAGITRIAPQTYTGYGENGATKVAVTVTHDGASLLLPFETFTDALAYSDELAALVNEARAAP